jgi:hypothetical protein
MLAHPDGGCRTPSRFSSRTMGEIDLPENLRNAIADTHKSYIQVGTLTQDLAWDQFSFPPENTALAAGYALAAAMALLVIVLPAGLAALAIVFISGGVYVAIEETLEDSITAEIVT